MDHFLFEIINHRMSNPVFDFVMPLFREKLFWTPLYLAVAFALLYKLGIKRGLVYILFIAITASCADLSSSKLVKPVFKRIRPCNDPEVNVIERVKCGAGYSFTSSHATNHTALGLAMALSLSVAFKIRRNTCNIVAFGWAFLISFAQIYVGVHYPGDILGGICLGAAIFWLSAQILRAVEKHLLKNDEARWT